MSEEKNPYVGSNAFVEVIEAEVENIAEYYKRLGDSVCIADELWKERRKKMEIKEGHVVWKFQIGNRGSATISMPKDSVIVHAAVQDEVPTFWAICDPDAEKVERNVHILATGQPAPPNCVYCATFFKGPFVWHVVIERQ